MTIFQTSTAGVLTPQDADLPWWLRLRQILSERRSQRVICVVACVWLLNFFDLTLTLLAHDQGMLFEQNPVARGLLQDGPIFLALYKVGLLLVGSYPLLRFRRARITELGALVVLVAYATLAVHWSTCYQLYTITASFDVSDAEIEALTGPHFY